MKVYLTLYQGFQALRELRDQEKQDGAALSPLAFDRSLSPGERGHYLELLGRVNYSNTMIGYISAGLLGQAAEAGIRIRKSDFDRSRASWKNVPQLQGCVDFQPIPLVAE